MLKVFLDSIFSCKREKKTLYLHFSFAVNKQAVEATKNVELGNKELSQAIQRNSSSRTFLLLFLFVLTFSILFLDWYN